MVDEDGTPAIESRAPLRTLTNLVQVRKCSVKIPIKIFVSALSSITQK